MYVYSPYIVKCTSALGSEGLGLATASTWRSAAGIPALRRGGRQAVS